MIPAISIPSTPIVPTVAAIHSVASPASSTAVDMPLSSVNTARETQLAYNNTKNAASPRTAQTPATTAAPSALSFSGMVNSDTSVSPLRFSSAFLAQWLSQSSPSQAESITTFYDNDNVPRDTLDSRLIEIYSLVKYKPSFAARPTPEPLNIQPLDLSQPTPVKIAQAPVAANPIFGVFQRAAQARAEAGSASSMAAIGSLPKKVVADNDNSEAPAAANDAAPRKEEKFASLITQSGVRAYQASFVRNQANLVAEKPETIEKS